MHSLYWKNKCKKIRFPILGTKNPNQIVETPMLSLLLQPGFPLNHILAS